MKVNKIYILFIAVLSITSILAYDSYIRLDFIEQGTKVTCPKENYYYCIAEKYTGKNLVYTSVLGPSGYIKTQYPYYFKLYGKFKPEPTTTAILSTITSTIVSQLPSVNIDNVVIHGRLYPKPHAYGCGTCAVWEHGKDNSNFASSSVNDTVKLDVNMGGQGNVYVELEFWLSTSWVYPDNSPFVYYSTKKLYLDGSNQTLTFMIQSCLKNCLNQNLDIELGATGLHSARIRIYAEQEKKNLLYDTGLIKHLLDVF